MQVSNLWNLIVSYKLAIARKKKGRILSLYPVILIIQSQNCKIKSCSYRSYFIFLFHSRNRPPYKSHSHSDIKIVSMCCTNIDITDAKIILVLGLKYCMWRKKLESYSPLITNHMHIYHMTLEHLEYSAETYLSIIWSFKGVFLVLFWASEV